MKFKPVVRWSGLKRIDWLLWFLLLYAFLARILYLVEEILPFGFDHGKDSLAVLHMLVTHTPKLIGPWTSIPGLYFGPGWYYLLAPFLLLFNYNPAAAVIPLVLIILFQVGLVYKVFGLVPAVLVASAPLWLSISKSAWNPFPMTLISWLLLVVLQGIEQNKKFSRFSAISVGILSAFGFHFSAAFAIFYLPIVIVLALVRRWRISAKQILLVILGFALPFIPQALFELKHNFIEVRSVLTYFSQGETQSFTVSKVASVISTLFGEIRSASMPDLFFSPLSAAFALCMLVLLLSVFWKNWKQDEKLRFFTTQAICFTVIPAVGLSFLHFNVWYLLGLLPAITLLIGYALSLLRRPLKLIVLAVFLLSPVLMYFRYFAVDRAHHRLSTPFLSAKITAIAKVRDLAEGAPYATYVYAPDIYDFAYQYIYLSQALSHQFALPSDFSYQPNVPEYYQGKAELLAHVDPDFKPISTTPEKIFFIVEQPHDLKLLQAWWQQQSFQSITGEYQISPELTVFAASPSLQP